MAATPKKRLGELLVEAGIIDEHQLRAALGHQRQWGGKLGQALVDLKLASEQQIVSALSKKLGYEIVHLDALPATPALEIALKLVPRDVARRNNILPIAADVSSVTVVMSDPTNLAVTDEISFRTGRRVKIGLAGDKEVARAVARLYFPEEEREARSLEMEQGESVKPLNSSYDALPDHMQQRFFRSSLRDPSAPAEAAAPPPAPTPSPLPPRPAVAPTPPPVSGLAPPPAAGPRAVPEPSLASREAALRDALDRMALGDESPGGLRSPRLVAALAKALLRRGLVTEAEIIAELTQVVRR